MAALSPEHETGRILKEARDRLPTDQFEVLVKEEMETDTSMASRLINVTSFSVCGCSVSISFKK